MSPRAFVELLTLRTAEGIDGAAAPYLASPARKFHFISGLPRSGSTLLAAILNQNPRFRAGMTSPLADIMGVVMAEASSKNDFSFDVSDDQRVAMLRGEKRKCCGSQVEFDIFQRR